MAMTPVLAGVSLFVDYTTYDAQTGLSVGLSWRDLTANTAETSPVLMVEKSQGVYTHATTPLLDTHQYLVVRRVYTDGTLATIDTTRSPETDVVYATNFLGTLKLLYAGLGTYMSIAAEEIV